MAKLNHFLWTDLFSKASENDVTIQSTLKNNLLFKKLSAKEIDYVSKVVHLRHYEGNEVIFEQYEKGLGMYMIAKGGVDIKIRTPQSQEEMFVTTLKEGSFFGELALIDSDSKRTASAYAHGPTILIGFFKPDLMDIMERKPNTGVKILFQLSRVLGKRLHETTELLTVLSRQDIENETTRDEESQDPESIKLVKDSKKKAA